MADCSTSWWRRNAVKLALASTMSVGLAFGATAAYAAEPATTSDVAKIEATSFAVVSENDQVALSATEVEPAVETESEGSAVTETPVETPQIDAAGDPEKPAILGEDEMTDSVAGDIEVATDPDENETATGTNKGDDENATSDKEEAAPETDKSEGDETDPDAEEKPGEGEEGEEGDKDPEEDPEGDKDPDPSDPGNKPAGGTGWSTDASGNKYYYENNVLVWTVDKSGNRTYYKNGVATSPDCVFFEDPTTGTRYWYEGGKTVSSHSFYDPATNNWYWADADGTIARSKDAFIPTDSSVDMNLFLSDTAYRDSHGKWVRFDDNYVMVKGENLYDGGWYYFNPVTSEMVKHFAYITPKNSTQGKWVFYDEITGRMLYGEQYKTSNKTDSTYHWYYLNDYTGAVTYGWWTIPTSGKLVFYDRVAGWMMYKWVDTGDKAVGTNTNWHFFNRYTGECMTKDDRGNAAHDSWLRMYDGTSKTDKYIVVDKDNFRTIIFQRVGNDWDVAKVFRCGLGRPDANMGRGTQEGVWTLGENVPSYPVPDELWRANYPRMENDTTSGVRWRIHYIWDQGFHSTVYTSSIPAEQQLERYISDGCVRLLDADAKWLWDNCANGTRVYIWRRY